MVYDVYCDFDLQQHKKKYINYLEVCIDYKGKIMYAVPSHQMKCEDLCCKKLGITREQLIASCPQEFHYDYLNWLMDTCGCICVWTNFYMGKSNAKQQRALKILKSEGVYVGEV